MRPASSRVKSHKSSEGAARIARGSGCASRLYISQSLWPKREGRVVWPRMAEPSMVSGRACSMLSPMTAYLLSYVLRRTRVHSLPVYDLLSKIYHNRISVDRVVVGGDACVDPNASSIGEGSHPILGQIAPVVGVATYEELGLDAREERVDGL